MVLFYAELPILARINAKMHYFEPEIYWGGGHPLSTPPSALAAPSPIFANPPVIFFTILTLLEVSYLVICSDLR